MGRFFFTGVVLMAAVLAFSRCSSRDGENSNASHDRVVSQSKTPDKQVQQEASSALAEVSAPDEPIETAPVEIKQAPSAKSIHFSTPPSTPPPAAVVVAPQEQTVLLGSVELTAGIPGEGALTLVQIKAWLADPNQHAVLKPELPPGLAAGAGQITGIDANPMTRAKIELGRQLYFDKRLSSDSTVSCASCHDPKFGYAFNTQFGVGIDGQKGGRNSPVAYNRILSGPQFWDGRAESLEAQAVGPIANPIEMGNTHEACVATVHDIEGYQLQFDAIFGDDKKPVQETVTIDNIGRALATFERAIVTGPSAWDYYRQLADFERVYADDIEDLDELKEEDEELYNEYQQLQQASADHPINPSAIHGGELFFADQGGCTACHVGANFTDEKYHNLGVGMDKPDDQVDVGRLEVTKDDKNRGAFKTPTVRNVGLTAPYMHDGSQQTLEEVVAWYAKGGHPNESLSEKVKKLTLSDQDQKDLVEFMQALTGPLPQVERARLPQ